MVCLNNNNMIFSGLGWTAEHAETSMVEHLNRSVSEYRDKRRIEEPCYNPDLRDKLKEEQKQSLRYFLSLYFIFSFVEILFVTLFPNFLKEKVLPSFLRLKNGLNFKF